MAERRNLPKAEAYKAQLNQASTIGDLIPLRDGIRTFTHAQCGGQGVKGAARCRRRQRALVTQQITDRASQIVSLDGSSARQFISGLKATAMPAASPFPTFIGVALLIGAAVYYGS